MREKDRVNDKKEKAKQMTATTQKLRTTDIAYIGLFVALLAVCSWISIPMTVPFTLQTMGVFLAIGILGGKRGSLTVLTYILLGMVGLPVFSGFRGGFGVLFGSTGGYILGFLLSALLMWGIEALLGRKSWVVLVSMILGLLVCYTFGTAWFMIVYARSTGPVGLLTALGWCVFPFMLPDGVKIALAYVLSLRLRRFVK